MNELQNATFGNGCFWCTEAIFQQVKGVTSTKSGYSGGHVDNPTYEEVCSGRTGHAEVLHLSFDPSIISFSELLDIFWSTHDPTTLNQQGADKGTQYRSVIFYHSHKQQKKAEEAKEKLNDSKVWDNPIVTEITRFESFVPSEDYHNDYFRTHGHEPYCSLVIAPKVEKFRKKFVRRLA